MAVSQGYHSNLCLVARLCPLSRFPAARALRWREAEGGADWKPVCGGGAYPGGGGGTATPL